ncbi:Fanconi anemia group G protein isoform X2 [Bombina bombina]|uniref:Fanconi anemia group G protein isoform X2 n=1 Tax=Bombina bombina TaxID=8345 RepID=UPI00235A49E0|nr:Fanconi anemia group G protein isoform X2 [Bombina bombina]
MEEISEARDPGDGDCLRWWTEENNAILSQWQDSGSSKNSYLVRQNLQNCYTDLDKLLQKIQGLPATVFSLPLELTVLYNMMIFQLNLTSGFSEEHIEQIDRALTRVLETQRLDRDKAMSNSALWQRILCAEISPDLSASLHRLAALQGALWLSRNQLHDVHNLFRFLTSCPDVSSGALNEQLTVLIRSWRAPDESTDRHTAQTAQHLKDVLCTSAAFLQGIIAMDTGDLLNAVDFLHEAARSQCSNRILAEIYTCLGCCFHKMTRYQTALQYWKQALQADFRCLSGLYLSSQVYKHMGKTDAELDALCLLHKALKGHKEEPSFAETHFLVRTELICNISSLTSCVRAPTCWEVKYLIANRCLQIRRTEDAVEHYLDLLAAFQDGTHKDGLFPSPAPLPRIPQVFLETAAALIEEKRYQDAMTVIEEVISRTRDVIPERLTLERRGQDQMSCKVEQLNYILWAASAHLLQGRIQELLRDSKEAVSEFTRCINLLLKIQVINSENEDTMDKSSIEHCDKDLVTLDVMKASAFLRRGHQFLQLGKQKEALLNVQLGLQAMPAFPGAAVSLLSILWTMDRKSEAVSYWKKFQNNQTSSSEEWEAVKRALPLYLVLHVNYGFPAESLLMNELQGYLENNTEEMQIDNDS